MLFAAGVDKGVEPRIDKKCFFKYGWNKVSLEIAVRDEHFIPASRAGDHPQIDEEL